MAVAVFFVSQGIIVPDFSALQEPQLSAFEQPNGSDSAVVKTLTKCAQIKTTKNVSVFALVNDAFNINTPVLPVSVFTQQPSFFISAALPIVSARAPPA